MRSHRNVTLALFLTAAVCISDDSMYDFFRSSVSRKSLDNQKGNSRGTPVTFSGLDHKNIEWPLREKDVRIQYDPATPITSVPFLAHLEMHNITGQGHKFLSVVYYLIDRIGWRSNTPKEPADWLTDSNSSNNLAKNHSNLPDSNLSDPYSLPPNTQRSQDSEFCSIGYGKVHVAAATTLPAETHTPLQALPKPIYPSYRPHKRQDTRQEKEQEERRVTLTDDVEDMEDILRGFFDEDEQFSDEDDDLGLAALFADPPPIAAPLDDNNGDNNREKTVHTAQAVDLAEDEGRQAEQVQDLPELCVHGLQVKEILQPCRASAANNIITWNSVLQEVTENPEESTDVLGDLHTENGNFTTQDNQEQEFCVVQAPDACQKRENPLPSYTGKGQPHLKEETASEDFHPLSTSQIFEILERRRQAVAQQHATDVSIVKDWRARADQYSKSVEAFDKELQDMWEQYAELETAPIDSQSLEEKDSNGLGLCDPGEDLVRADTDAQDQEYDADDDFTFQDFKSFRETYGMSAQQKQACLRLRHVLQNNDVPNVEELNMLSVQKELCLHELAEVTEEKFDNLSSDEKSECIVRLILQIQLLKGDICLLQAEVRSTDKSQTQIQADDSSWLGLTASSLNQFEECYNHMSDEDFDAEVQREVRRIAERYPDERECLKVLDEIGAGSEEVTKNG